MLENSRLHCFRIDKPLHGFSPRPPLSRLR
nr:MAG TPA: hypothetical protein [Caudoviricetes sp.]